MHINYDGIYRINSSKQKKKKNAKKMYVMKVLQVMVLHIWTNQQTSLSAHHLKYNFSHSEMPEPKSEND